MGQLPAARFLRDQGLRHKSVGIKEREEIKIVRMIQGREGRVNLFGCGCLRLGFPKKTTEAVALLLSSSVEPTFLSDRAAGGERGGGGGIPSGLLHLHHRPTSTDGNNRTAAGAPGNLATGVGWELGKVDWNRFRQFPMGSRWNRSPCLSPIHYASLRMSSD